MPYKNHTAKLIHATPNGDDLIADMARISNPDNRGNTETAPRLIRYLIRNGHWSPFQMVSMAIEVHTTRIVGRQILRHLSAVGFQEFSGRYAEYASLNDHLECRFRHPVNRQLSRPPETDEEMAISDAWDAFVAKKAKQDEVDYKYWLGMGVAKEQARGLLPEGLVPTDIVMHLSIRSWLHYIAERNKEGVQAEHRAIASACKAILMEKFPMVGEAFFDGK